MAGFGYGSGIAVDKQDEKGVAMMRNIIGLMLGAWLGLAAGARAQYAFMTNDDSSLKILAYTGALYTVEIPASIDGREVTIIGEEAFQNQALIESVTMPDSVAIIEDRAFRGCAGLTSLVLGAGLRSIGVEAFATSGLPRVELPHSVTGIGMRSFAGNPVEHLRVGDGLENVPRSAFDFTQLRSVQTGNGLRQLGGFDDVENPGTGPLTFDGAAMMTQALVGGGITSMGYRAFADCAKLPDLTVPDSVVEIGMDAFYQTTGLTSVWLGAGVKQIGSSAFYNSGLQRLEVPGGVEIIQSWAFHGATSLAHVAIGGGVTQIGVSAFGNTAMTQMNIPGNVQTIGAEALINAKALRHVVIGTGTTVIGQGAFRGTVSLTSIWVHADNPAYTSEDGILFDKEQTKLVQYPAGATSAAYSVGATVETIGQDSFQSVSHLEQINIPGNVRTIERWAFPFSSNLRRVGLAEGVESIGSYAFGWTGLESVAIPASVTDIGDHAFHRTLLNTQFMVHVDNPAYSSVDGVLFDKSQSTLIQYALGLAGSYAVPTSTAAIRPRAFEGAGHLTQLAIPDSVLNIGESTFHSCTSLARVVLGSGITNIGNSAFSFCRSLTSVVIPASVARIGSQTFFYCSSLRHVVFAGNGPVTSEWAFENAPHATIYRHPDSTGWPEPGEPFAGRPVQVGLPPMATEGRMGMTEGRFEFDLGWAASMPVVVEATHSPTGTWQAVWTSAPPKATDRFMDPSAAMHSQRLYRVRWP